MCWYKIESKDILLSLQKYFIVLLTMFTFSQQIVGGNISENIKEEFEKIKQNQICSCCINFQDSDMQFAMVLSQTNEELKKTNGELNETKVEQDNILVKAIEDLNKMEEEKNENEAKLIENEKTIKNYENEKNKILIEKNNLDEQLGEIRNKLNELKEEYKKNEEKLKKNEEMINNYENDKNQNLIEKDELNVQLEEKCKELKALDEKYKKNEQKYKENNETINKYKNEIKKCNEERNQIVFENKNLNEQIKNFSSNVNDVDLMNFQQKADENKSREIVNIFNDKTPGQPLTDTGIFYLPFQFLGDETFKTHMRYLESGFKEDLKDSKEKNSCENNKKREFKGKGGNTPTKNDHTYKRIQNNQNSNNTRNDLNKTTQNNMKIKRFIKEKTSGNLFSSKNPFSISEKTEEDKEVIKIRNNEFYLKANSDFP